MKKTMKLFALMLAASLFHGASGFAENPASTLNCLENSSQTGSFSCDKESGNAVSSTDGSQKPSTVSERKKKRRKGKKDNTGKKPPKGKKGKGKPKKDNLRKKK